MSDRWKDLRRVFRLPLGRRGVEGEVVDELRFHLEERIEELMATGLSRVEAEREAKARFGDLPTIRRAVKQIDRRMARRRSIGETLEAVGRDVRFGLRALTKTPGFTSVAVLTLALGIGANTAIFSALNGVLLRPLAVPYLDRLFVIQQDVPGLKLLGGQLTPSQAEELATRRDFLEVFTGVTGGSFNLTGSGEPQRINGVRTMGRFFELFSLAPALGRFYRAEDSQNGNTRVAVLSNGFWRSWAGGDPAVIGRSIELNGSTYQVIGVLPAGFRYRQSAQVFVPLEITQQMRRQGPWMISAIGRLRAGVSRGQVSAQLANITAQWQADPSRAYPPELHFSLRGTSLVDVQAGELKPVLLLLMGAVSLVLLIACANVANLQLVRAAGRARELAVRAAMGAGRWPIMRQLIVENAILAGAGGALGLSLGFLAIRALRGLDATQLPALANLQLDPPVLAFTAAATMLAVLCFGVAPTVRAARTDLHGVLRDSTRGSSAGAGRNRLLRVSAAIQVALSLMLLLGAGLLIRSLALLLEVDPGFKASHVLTFRVSLPGASYQTEAQRTAFFDAITERLAGLPGVEAVGAISDLPFGEGRNSSPFKIPDKPVAPGEPERHADMRFVEGDYFKTLGIPVIRGRSFGPEDRSGSPWVAVIDESLARQYFGTEDPIGRGISQGRTATIVGVVGAIKHGDLTEPDKPAIYYAYSQAPWYSGLYLTVRTRQDRQAMLAEAKAQIAEVDRSLPVYDVGSMQERVDHSLGTRRLAMVVLSGFAVLALLLALLGVYGVLSYSTSRRTHELGIRMALGAVPGDVIRMVLGSGLALTGLGLAAGLAGFLILARFLAAILYGVTPRDPLTIAAGILVLGCGAAAAAFIPARRAARVDPVQALREE
jgi:putative ABC transport system permease protein